MKKSSIVLYTAADGKCFTTVRECEAHEKELYNLHEVRDRQANESINIDDLSDGAFLKDLARRLFAIDTLSSSYGLDNCISQKQKNRLFDFATKVIEQETS